MLLKGKFLIEKCKYFVLMDELFKNIRCGFIFIDTIQREIYIKVIQMLGRTNNSSKAPELLSLLYIPDMFDYNVGHKKHVTKELRLSKDIKIS